MDLKTYFQKIRDIEAKILEAFAVVVSLESPGGGKGKVFTEVLPRVAGKLVVDGMARLASAAEAKAFREQQAEAKLLAEQAAAASRVQVSVLPTSELERLKSAIVAPKE